MVLCLLVLIFIDEWDSPMNEHCEMEFHDESSSRMIQFNDRSRGRFDPELISSLETIARQSAIALAQRKTEERLREHQVLLQTQNRDLALANKELEAFSYSVSHDLCAPLRHVTGFSQALLKECADELDEKGQNYVGKIIDSTKRMNRLIDDMLRLSHLTQRPLNIHHVDLSKIAGLVAEGLQSSEPEREVDFKIGEGLIVQADEGLARILMENLLDNAWKFTGKRKEAKIEFGAEEIAGSQTFFVRDNGAGFRSSDFDELFLPFSRLHNEKEYRGSGIGLATVKRIVDRHGGKVWAEGEKGKGATFYFAFN